jgi:putative transposase
MIFGFIAAKKAEHSIKIMCRVLEVSRSGYHAWARRPPSPRAVEDARLTVRIKELFKLRRDVYGSPRIWADLVLDNGERLGRKRVERLMRQAGLCALMEKKWKATTVRVPGVRVADDLLDRDFAAAAPNRCWVADITYLRTWEGWLYLVAVQDLYGRRIVGWSMADHMRAELVTDALEMALAHRRPDPPRLPIDCAIPAAQACWPKASETNWLPWSECQINPAPASATMSGVRRRSRARM